MTDQEKAVALEQTCMTKKELLRGTSFWPLMAKAIGMLINPSTSGKSLPVAVHLAPFASYMFAH